MIHIEITICCYDCVITIFISYICKSQLFKRGPYRGPLGKTKTAVLPLLHSSPNIFI